MSVQDHEEGIAGFPAVFAIESEWGHAGKSSVGSGVLAKDAVRRCDVGFFMRHAARRCVPMLVIYGEDGSPRKEVFRVEYDQFIFHVAEEWQLSLLNFCPIQKKVACET